MDVKSLVEGCDRSTVWIYGKGRMGERVGGWGIRGCNNVEVVFLRWNEYLGM